MLVVIVLWLLVKYIGLLLIWMVFDFGVVKLNRLRYNFVWLEFNKLISEIILLGCNVSEILWYLLLWESFFIVSIGVSEVL